MNVECRMKEFYLFYLLKRAERSLRLVGVAVPTPRRATATIRQSSIIIRHSMKFHMSCLGFFQPETLNPWPRPGSDVNASIPAVTTV